MEKVFVKTFYQGEHVGFVGKLKTQNNKYVIIEDVLEIKSIFDNGQDLTFKIIPFTPKSVFIKEMKINNNHIIILEKGYAPIYDVLWKKFDEEINPKEELDTKEE